jgi:uncharacterized DUF497 family protein
MGEFEWDEAKSAATRRQRDFDFTYASHIFEGPTLERPDDRRDYGEERIRAIGRVETEILFVVYTWRGNARRIISARPAHRKERDAYRAVYS